MKKQETLILVGFGPHDLDEMLKWIGTEREEELLFAPDTWPPRFRAESSCSLKEYETFLQYVNWATEFIKKISENNDKEND